MNQRMRMALYCVVFGGLTWNISALDIELTPPVIELHGDFAAIPGIDVSAFNFEIAEMADEFEFELENNPDLLKFTDQLLLPLGFANAGASGAHVGTQRSFIDYTRFALSFGTGLTAAIPGSDITQAQKMVELVAESGDLYTGLAIQPLNASLGINLNPLVRGLKVNAKVGAYSLPEGQAMPGISFESVNVGLGATYQLVRPRALPLKIIRWHGLSLGSGFNYQSSSSAFAFQASGDAFEAEGLTLGDLGMVQSDLDDFNTANPSADPLYESTMLGALTVLPSLNAAVDSHTLTVPLEINTGVRLLWLLDLNFGAGVDLVMGRSTLNITAATDVNFVSSPEMEDYVTFTPGRASLTIEAENEPQFARPRVSVGAGLKLGPLWLDVPFMYYLDAEGSTWLLGVNVGIVW